MVPGREGGESPIECFFSDLDAFWAPGASHGAPKELPKAFSRAETFLAVSLQKMEEESKTNQTR